MEYVPLLPPLRPGAKRRKNAKAESINKLFYMHEEIATLYNLVGLAFRKLGLANSEDEKFHWTVPRSGDLDCPGIATSYSIAHTAHKDMTLSDNNEFQEIMDEVTIKKKPAIKLKIVEQKVRVRDHTH